MLRYINIDDSVENLLSAQISEVLLPSVNIIKSIADQRTSYRSNSGQ